MFPLLEHLGGVVTEADLEVRRQGRTMASALTVTTCAGALCTTAYLLLGAWADAAVGVLSTLGAPLALVLWRVKRHAAPVINFSVAWYLVLFVGAGMATQALGYLAWTGVLPVVAFLGGGLALGLRWTVLTLVSLAVASAILLLFPFEFTVPGTPLVRLIRVLTMPPTLAALGYFFERSRQKSAQELDAARLTAEQANQAKGRLLARVSHEIRTPLNGVLGLTQSLLHQGLPEAAHADLLLVQQSGKGLLSLINDLLDVARAESGKLELHLAPVDLAQMLREVTLLYRETAHVRGLSLTCQVSATPCWVRTDEVRLRQVVGNLLANALKFTEEGSVTARLTQGPERDGRLEVALVVEDTGRGIAPEDRQRLFEPFSQLHAGDAGLGSGLGLAISRELARQLGGDVSADSATGKGSVFTVRLVLERAEAPTEREPGVEPLASFRALVVDDNALNRRVAGALLARLGASVELASDGHEALAAADGHTFDVVMMDLQMPRLDGFEATRRLRSRGFVAPIVALTASAGPDTRSQCLSSGMNECVTKPIQLQQLRAVLASVMAQAPSPS